jgi:hypothetical protein
MLGVTAEDLRSGEARLPRNFQGTEKARQEAVTLLDKKRSEVLEAVNSVRTSVTQSQVEQLLYIEQRAPGNLRRVRAHSAPDRQLPTSSAAGAPEMATLMRREQQRLETLRRTMKEEIQSLLEDEYRKQTTEKEKKAKEAKYNERLAAMAETRELEKEKREKEMAAKHEKKEALMKEKERKMKELKKQLEGKMREKMKKVGEQKQVILELKHKEAEAFSHKLIQAKKSIQAKNEAKEQEAMGKFVALVQKWDKIADRKKQIEQEGHQKAEAHTTAYQAKIAHGREISEQQTEAKVSVFLEENSRFQKARLLADERRQEQLTAMIDKNKKKAEQARALTERTRQEAKEKLKQIRQEFAHKNSKDASPVRQQLAAALVQRIRDHRVVHDVVVQDNRQRIVRARSFEVDKRLALLDVQTERNEVFKQQKEKLNEERNKTLVKSWIEKSQLLKQIDKLKNSANNEKVFARLVKNLGISTIPLSDNNTNNNN